MMICRTRELIAFALLVCAVVVLTTTTANAGGGKVRVVQDPTKEVGEIDLTVAFSYDPASSIYDVERYKKLMRQASVMLCDATEGFFRIGTVRFVRSGGGLKGADIYAFDDEATSQSTCPGISFNGASTKLYRPHAMTVAHELGHYVFGVSDEYQPPDRKGPCFRGQGFDGTYDSVNTSMMEFSHFTTSCFVRANSQEDWPSNGSGTCAGVEDCVQLAIDQGITPVWGYGSQDTVRCDVPTATELTTFMNHDSFNGLGAGFDRRTTDGGWGETSWGTTYKEQLDFYTQLKLACSDPSCVLEHCPQPRGTQRITATVNLADVSIGQTPLSDVPAVGNVLTVTDAESRATASRTMGFYDDIGRWNKRDGAPCPSDKDSIHGLYVYLQNIEPAPGEQRQYALWYGLADDDYIGGTPDHVRVLGVEFIDSVFAGNLNLDINISGLKNNECYMEVEGGAPRGAVQDPNPVHFTMELTFESGTQASIGVAWQRFGSIGDCEWESDSATYCAQYWQPYADNLQDGEWASTRQSVENGEWDWATVQRRYSSFVNIDSRTHIPVATNNECYYYKEGGAAIKGAYDVTFQDMTGEDADVFLVMDRSGSMSTKDGPADVTRHESAMQTAWNFASGLNQWVTQPSGDQANIAFVRFDNIIDCMDVGAGPNCAMGDIAQAGTLDAINDLLVNELTPRGSTALVDAIRLAAGYLNLYTQPGREKYIYVVTDGYENASSNPDVASLLTYLQSLKISIYALGVGNDADRVFLQQITDQTGGALFYSDSADNVGNQFARMTNSSRDGSELIPMGELISDPNIEGPTRPEGKANFEVETGTSELTVVITNGGYEVPPPPGTPIDWDLYVWLSDGVNYYKKSYTGISPEVLAQEDQITIRIANPAAGPWTLTTKSTKGVDLRSNLTVTVRNPNTRSFVNTQPKVPVDGDTVTITPTTSYQNVGLDMNWANCTGRVRGPAGFDQPLIFTNSPSRIVEGLPPQAEISSFNGRGFYSTEVTCQVTEDTKPNPEFTGTITVEPFNHTATDWFFLDTPTMPPSTSSDPNDDDEDDVPNDQECAGDGDGDGWPGYRDRDCDNDDVMDGDDNCPCVFNSDQTDSNGDGKGDACDSIPLEISGGESTTVVVSPVGNVAMAAFIETPWNLNVGRAPLTIQKLLSEKTGHELVWPIPVTMTPAWGSTYFEAHYLSLPLAVEVVTIPFVGHLVYLSAAPTVVEAPAACQAGASSVILTTTFAFGGSVPVVASVDQEWQCLAGGGICLAP